MNRRGGNNRVRGLAASVAVLLLAGAGAAVAVHPGGPTTAIAGGRAGATGVGGTVLLDDEGPTGSTTVTVASPAVPTSAPAPSAPTSTTATTKPPTRSPATTPPPAPAGGTAATLPPGVPWPDLPPSTGIPNIPPSSSWSGERDGVRVQLRLDPPSPVAGQPVRFVIDYSSAEPCCTVMLGFGDGTDGFSLNNDRGACATAVPLTPGAHRAVATHTYAGAGSYKANLFVVAGDSCANPPALVNGAPQLVIHAVAFDACLGVGPGPAAQKGCSPFPPFGPDTLVSPVIDPFCQVRSDCTKASTPRPGWDA